VNVSLAIDYAVGGLNVLPYHVTNLLIHIAAALTLFGVLRRTLRSLAIFPGTKNGDGGDPRATSIALAATLLWAVHPLQTESVTYMIQRAEAMMGLLYLLVMYATIRAASAGGKNATTAWYVVAVACSCLGMATKEAMVTAPLLTLLYDRTFLSGSFRAALRRRWKLYVGLAASWGVLAAVIVPGRGGTAGLAAKVGVLDYAQTQPGVILHYLRLAFWPWPLVLDYGWPVAHGWEQIAPPAVAIGVLVVLTLWALVATAKRPPIGSDRTAQVVPVRALGFLGAWFFLVLAPSSSIYPLNDIAFEHRMYLSLAAVMVLVTLAAHWAWCRLGATLSPSWGLAMQHPHGKDPSSSSLSMPVHGQAQQRSGHGTRRGILFRSIPAVALLAILGVFIGLTLLRNCDYASEQRMWEQTLARTPNNTRALLNVGAMWFYARDYDKALNAFNRALQLRPEYEDAYVNRANVYWETGHSEQALADFARAIQLRPRDGAIYGNRGAALGRLGRNEEAIADLDHAIRLRPDYAEAYFNRGVTYAAMGRHNDAALADFAQAIHYHPNYAQAFISRGLLLLNMQHFDAALGDLNMAIKLSPKSADAYQGRAVAYYFLGDIDKAKADLATSERLGLPARPEFIEALQQATGR
jgi:tetratricopeptide (TPR) repeat protein